MLVKSNVMYVSFYARLMELAQLEMMTPTSPSPKSTMRQKVQVKRFVLHTILKNLCLCLLVSKCVALALSHDIVMQEEDDD